MAHTNLSDAKPSYVTGPVVLSRSLGFCALHCVESVFSLAAEIQVVPMFVVTTDSVLVACLYLKENLWLNN